MRVTGRRLAILALALVVCPGVSIAQFEPPSILVVLNPDDSGRTSNAVRTYYIDKGLGGNLAKGDILHVYREKRASSADAAVRFFLGTMKITSSRNDYSFGHFTPNEAAIASPLIRYRTAMKTDLVLPVHIISTDDLFDQGLISLRPAADQEFQQVADFVGLYSPGRLIIEGHSDSDGTEEVNQELSLSRAEAVRQYLIENFNAITPAMVESRGLGSRRPAVPNDSPENKRLNRRIEIIVWN
ncbi:MAG: OmpA family protein [Gemmatimonadetes bacterium]|nr:OmpA family protein [Gemmatimonadota bacterium]MBT7861628.1 OmpA family protein [Gemmatimonadota bacterium]